ncbi:MAG: hypothetical protein FWG44_01380 [Oscillospiraceae bacterium]|nr:hypothetical protein [Oscillospiraceae bacterium]
MFTKAMKVKINKVLALVLAVIMTASLGTLTVSAQEEQRQRSNLQVTPQYKEVTDPETLAYLNSTLLTRSTVSLANGYVFSDSFTFASGATLFYSPTFKLGSPRSYLNMAKLEINTTATVKFTVYFMLPTTTNGWQEGPTYTFNFNAVNKVYGFNLGTSINYEAEYMTIKFIKDGTNKNSLSYKVYH